MKKRDPYRFLFVSVPFSGIEVFFKKLEDIYSKRGDIECHWIWIDESPKELIAHIPPFSMNWTLKAAAIARLRISQLEKQHGHFDAVLFNNIMPATFLGEFRRRVPFGISMDCTPELIAKEPYSTWFLNRKVHRHGILGRITRAITTNAYAAASFLLPYSSVASASLEHDYGVEPDKITIVPVGVDLRRWQLNVDTPKERAKASELSILFIGGDFKRKGGDILFLTAQRPEFRNCTFHVLTRTIPSSIPDNVKFHNNIRANSPELMQIYADADVFVMPTKAEFPQTNAILEAMAMQLPVITTNLPGLDDVVLHNTTGFIIPTHNDVILSSYLLTLKESPGLRRAMGIAGRTRVETEYNLAHIAETILARLRRSADATAARSQDGPAVRPSVTFRNTAT